MKTIDENLYVVHNALTKLMIDLPDGGTLTAEHVQMIEKAEELLNEARNHPVVRVRLD